MIDLIFIIGAKYVFALSFVISGMYFLIQPFPRKKHMIIFATVALSIIYVGAYVAGHLYFDPRPFIVGHFEPLIPHAPDNGFPSDHALLTSAIAAIITFFSRRIAVILWVVAIFVAISRVYVGLHHPIDVIGSFFISLVGATIAYIFIKYTWSQKLT
jgi:undecaprenyl-diphosphatase